MPNPAVLTVTGTGTLAWIPDWMQCPFQVGIMVVNSGTTGVNGTATIDATWSNLDTLQPGGIASSAAAWTAIFGPIGPTGTTIIGIATFTSPCQGLRLNVFSATATSTIQATFVQATFPR